MADYIVKVRLERLDKVETVTLAESILDADKMDGSGSNYDILKRAVEQISKELKTEE